MANNGCCGDQRRVTCTVPATARATISINNMNEIVILSSDVDRLEEIGGFTVHVLDIVPYPTGKFLYQFVVQISYRELNTPVTVSCSGATGLVTKIIPVQGKFMTSIV